MNISTEPVIAPGVLERLQDYPWPGKTGRPSYWGFIPTPSDTEWINWTSRTDGTASLIKKKSDKTP